MCKATRRKGRWLTCEGGKDPFKGNNEAFSWKAALDNKTWKTTTVQVEQQKEHEGWRWSDLVFKLGSGC